MSRPNHTRDPRAHDPSEFIGFPLGDNTATIVATEWKQNTFNPNDWDFEIQLQNAKGTTEKIWLSLINDHEKRQEIANETYDRIVHACDLGHMPGTTQQEMLAIERGMIGKRVEFKKTVKAGKNGKDYPNYSYWKNPNAVPGATAAAATTPAPAAEVPATEAAPPQSTPPATEAPAAAGTVPPATPF